MEALAKSIRRQQGKDDRVLFQINSVEGWPLHATRNRWAKFLGINYETVKNAYDRGDLDGHRLNNRVYHTFRQILTWRAPALLQELDEENAKKRIERLQMKMQYGNNRRDIIDEVLSNN